MPSQLSCSEALQSCIVTCILKDLINNAVEVVSLLARVWHHRCVDLLHIHLVSICDK